MQSRSATSRNALVTGIAHCLLCIPSWLRRFRLLEWQRNRSSRKQAQLKQMATVNLGKHASSEARVARSVVRTATLATANKVALAAM